MINRWAVKDLHNYYIYGNSYDIKDEIKALGGKWNPEHKRWELPRYEKELKFIRDKHIPFRIKVKMDPYCHESGGISYLLETDFRNGYTCTTLFCGNCDSHYRNPVKVEVVDD